MTLHSPWRWTAALLLVTTAAIHIALVPQHLREAPYAGVLFAALSATALIVAALLVTREHPALWAAAAGLSLVAIGGYVASRSVGLPMMADDVGDWLNSLGVAALASEALTVTVCWWAVRAGGRSWTTGTPFRGASVIPRNTVSSSDG
jgi:hypothetical protein